MKDTLIRGINPQPLNKYWGRFNKTATDIQDRYQYLLQAMPIGNPAKKYMQRFAQIYPKWINAYITGDDGMIQSKYDISRTDKSVSSIDN